MEKIKKKIFFERTLYNLKLYEENHLSDPDKYNYEVTMLLNSLLGLLVIQRERTNLLASVDISFLNCECSADDFFRHMRNSISHGHFIDNIQVDLETKEIKEIEFIDKNRDSRKVTFRQTLTVNQLKTLIEKIRETLP